MYLYLLHSLEVAVHILRLAVDELAGMVRAELLEDTMREGSHNQDGSVRGNLMIFVGDEKITLLT